MQLVEHMVNTYLRAMEFFEGEGKALSMARLLVFLAFWPAAYVVVIKPGADTLTIFLTAFVAQYGLSKFGDAAVMKQENNAA